MCRRALRADKAGRFPLIPRSKTRGEPSGWRTRRTIRRSPRRRRRRRRSSRVRSPRGSSARRRRWRIPRPRRASRRPSLTLWTPAPSSSPARASRRSCRGTAAGASRASRARRGRTTTTWGGRRRPRRQSDPPEPVRDRKRRHLQLVPQRAQRALALAGGSRAASDGFGRFVRVRVRGLAVRG